MQTIGILGNPVGANLELALEALLDGLRERFPESKLILSSELSDFTTRTTVSVAASILDLANKSDLLFSLGGDGTMLLAARAISREHPNASLIGLNLGRLGFLSENQPEETDELLDLLLQDKLKTEKRLMLSATIASETGAIPIVKRDDLRKKAEGLHLDRSLKVLNEIVIDNYGSTRMLTLEVSVDGALLGVMRADGIIIATPTGSTGYAVSAGGPIVEPTSPVMLITPIAPHSLNIRPIVVPENCTIQVRASSDETSSALVVADGQEEVVVETSAIVTISANKDRLNLLRRKDRSYFELLRNKLLWSMDHRHTGRQ